MDFLFSKEILDIEDIERIKAQPGPATKAREFMKTLQGKADHGWVFTFIESLQAGHDSKPLAELIMTDL